MNEVAEAPATQENPTVDQLATVVRTAFEEAKTGRYGKEQEWLKDLRQYQGKYEPDVEARMDPDRSHAFARFTRIKVRTMDARLANLLFPGGKEKNWSISPTPKPQLPREVIEAQRELITAVTAEVPDDETMEKVVKELAKDACGRMETTISDQLTEARWQVKARKVLHSGHLYGTGIIKGPMVDRKQRRAWRRTPAGFVATSESVTMPYMEWRSLWNVYVDPEAIEPEDANYIIDRHLMTKQQVRKLKKQGFNAQAIEEVVRANQNGTAVRLNHETERRLMVDGLETVVDVRGRYEVLEYWGVVRAADLLEALGPQAVPPMDCDDDEEIEAQIWVLGNRVIKASLNPFDRQTRPFHFYVPDKDEMSIYGNSIPGNVRNSQEFSNAALRATIDNAGMAVGPMAEINMDLLDPSETEPRKVHPLRVYLRRGRGIEANYPAVRFQTIPNNTAAMLQLFDRAKLLLDEESNVPSYMHGDADKGGAGNTLGGLSMLMGASNITIADYVASYDSGITEPMLSAFYDWNMQFSTDESIKGDYAVAAKGSTTLMARELRTQQLQSMAGLAANPLYAKFFDHYELISRMESEMELDGIVRDKTEIEAEEENNGSIDPRTGQPIATGAGGPRGPLPPGAPGPLPGGPGSPGGATVSAPAP